MKAHVVRWVLSKRPLQAASLGLVACLFVLLALRVVADNHASALAGEVAAGKAPPAPSFTLGRLNGRGRLDLATLRGKVVVLNFWASWCVPCKEEARVLERAWNRWRGRGIVFVGIDSQDFSGDARRFMRRYGMTYPSVHDGPGATAARYGVVGFPETWLVSRRGRLVDHIAGPLAADRLDVDVFRALAS